jgi:hypothetical protein
MINEFIFSFLEEKHSYSGDSSSLKVTL